MLNEAVARGRAARPRGSAPGFFEDLRAREFALVDNAGIAYLDYTGAALPAASQLDAHHALLRTTMLGNPHSEHRASRASTDAIDAARRRVLQFFNAAPDEYGVVFTANASAAMKLVGESFPFGPGSRYVVSADNHNSVNGIREFALRAGARLQVLPLTPELCLEDDAVLSVRRMRGGAAGLFAFPAQSNFSGVRHPLAFIAEAQRRGYRVLLDAAAFAPSSPLNLEAVHPDFVAVSFYKMFGYPTGVGALIARHDALAELARPWFAGGTVDWVSVAHSTHQLKHSGDAFEDGTPNFASIAALDAGFTLLERIGMSRLHERVGALTDVLLSTLTAATHANGAPAFVTYGPRTREARGGIVALNALDSRGAVIPYEHLELRASAERVAVRGGCFCNPGASEAAFALPRDRTVECLRRAGAGGFTPRKFADCLGSGVPVGAIRVSVGAATSVHDIRRGVAVLTECALAAR